MAQGDALTHDETWQEEKCGNCRFWIRQERNREQVRMNNQLGNAVDMSQPVMGTCRAAPPTCTGLPQPNGHIIQLSNYPVLNDNNPACAQFQPAKKLVEA